MNTTFKNSFLLQLSRVYELSIELSSWQEGAHDSLKLKVCFQRWQITLHEIDEQKERFSHSLRLLFQSARKTAIYEEEKHFDFELRNVSTVFHRIYAKPRNESITTDYRSEGLISSRILLTTNF